MTEAAALAAPLTYPGLAPATAAVLVMDGELLEVTPSAAGVGEWLTETDQGAKPLDAVLAANDASPMAARRPVLAVGSNAAPAQVIRKFSSAGARGVVPITAVTARGVAVGVSAHVSKPGYVPATPVFDPAAVSRLFLTWLDDDGLRVMDATEPNYDRSVLDEACTVELPNGRPVSGCLVYVSKHGYLTDRRGLAREPASQSTLIEGLLADVPELKVIAGTTPEEWITRMRDPQVRDKIRQIFRDAGIVREGSRAPQSPEKPGAR